MRNKADAWIAHLKLEKHPEGGYFNECYRSDESIAMDALPQRFSGDRSISTSIYFLLKKNEFSAFHRIKSDETWYFHDGAPLEIYVLDPEKGLQIKLLGLDTKQDCLPQQTVKHGMWFASRSKGDFSLVGCTVAPGFDFSDFEMASAEALHKEFPEHVDIINTLSV